MVAIWALAGAVSTHAKQEAKGGKSCFDLGTTLWRDECRVRE